MERSADRTRLEIDKLSTEIDKLRGAAWQEGVGDFSGVDAKHIGDRYGELLRGRAEVWFPSLADRVR